jgi:hypothetical protein
MSSAEGAADLIMRKLWHREPLEISTIEYVSFRIREFIIGCWNAIFNK